MTIEQRRCLLRALANFRFRKSLSGHPDYFCNRGRHERLDPVEALDRAFAAPAIEQRLSSLPGRNVSQRVANFIRIENPGCVAVHIKENKSARLIQVDMFG